jgi:hypothetical protein
MGQEDIVQYPVELDIEQLVVDVRDPEPSLVIRVRVTVSVVPDAATGPDVDNL